MDGLVGGFGDVVTGSRALVLGAGGAGLAVGAGLSRAGRPAAVTFLNRTPARAEAAALRCATSFAAAFEAGPLDAHAFVAHARDADVIVQGHFGSGG